MSADDKMDVAEWFAHKTRHLLVESVLDVGSGANGVVGMHIWNVRAQRKFALDIWDMKALPPDWIAYPRTDARDMARIFAPKSLDIVQACDFVEHLEKEEALRWLKLAETIARKAVLIFTPAGFMPQDEVAGNPHQTHKSGWTPAEFQRLGYVCATQEESYWPPARILACKLLDEREAAR